MDSVQNGNVKRPTDLCESATWGRVKNLTLSMD
jgi:hypothetical protein